MKLNKTQAYNCQLGTPPPENVDELIPITKTKESAEVLWNHGIRFVETNSTYCDERGWQTAIVTVNGVYYVSGDVKNFINGWYAASVMHLEKRTGLSDE